MEAKENTFYELSLLVSEEMVKGYAELLGDHNPLHLDEEFAKTTKFSKPIAHGGILFGIFSRLLGIHLPGPGTVFLSQEIQFSAPVYIGEIVLFRVELEELLPKLGAKLSTKAWVDERLVASGFATVKLPAWNVVKASS